MHDCPVILHVKAYAGGKQTRIIAYERGTLHIKVGAKAVDGAANEALIDYLSDWLEIPKSLITITKGAFSPYKTLSLQRIDRYALEQKIELSCSLRSKRDDI